MKRIIVLFLLSLVLIGLTPGVADSTERPRVQATRTEAPVRVGGSLDEPVWTHALVIGGFRLILQDEGEAPL